MLRCCSSKQKGGTRKRRRQPSNAGQSEQRPGLRAARGEHMVRVAVLPFSLSFLSVSRVLSLGALVVVTVLFSCPSALPGVISQALTNAAWIGLSRWIPGSRMRLCATRLAWTAALRRCGCRWTRRRRCRRV